MSLQLYLHIPFCVKKCSYCDFLSAPADEETISHYILALSDEMDAVSASVSGPVDTVYIGGGTPSLLSAAQIGILLEQLHRCFDIAPDAEISMEANPGTLSEEKLKAAARGGVNRLSLGLQSVHSWELSLLGRIHSYEDFRQSFSTAGKAGFDNINIDLMYGLPGQSLADWRQTLLTAAALNPEHISAYSLTLEEGTPLYRLAGELPDEELWQEMDKETESVLSSFGLARYEISNYAVPGRECRHNKGYWTLKPYLGMGLGAASYLTDIRFSNTRDMKKYLRFAGHPDQIREDYTHLSVKEQMAEAMFLGLRLVEGVSSSAFYSRFGVHPEDIYGDVIEKYKKMGFLEEKNGFLRLTRRAFPVSNSIMCEFV